MQRAGTNASNAGMKDHRVGGEAAIRPKKTKTRPEPGFRADRGAAYFTSEISTPSIPWASVRASPPWASLILRRTSLAESA